MNLRQLLQHFTIELEDVYEEQEVSSIFYMTAQHLSGYNRSGVMLNWDKEIEEALSAQYLSLSAGLKTGKPIQYLLGEAHFYGLTFAVNEAVLIPRPETEELVEWILDTLKSDPASRKPNIIDFGTGSGCIAIALKSKLSEANLTAVDISTDAINLAAKNALSNKLTANFIQADILSFHTIDKFDVIVSNPPYITNAEKLEMHQNVLAHEPHLALFVPDERPLLFYEAIADFALKSLQENGYLFFEINEYLAKETISMLEAKSFKNIELRKDMQGKDRMIAARLS